MKLHVHNQTIVIYIQYNLQDISIIGYLVMAGYAKKSLKFRQSRGDNSCITNETPIELHVHNHTMVIYIKYNFSISSRNCNYRLPRYAEDEKYHLNLGNKNNKSAITDNIP